MTAATQAWKRAAELGDTGGDDSEFARWLNKITGGALDEMKETSNGTRA